MEYTEQLYRILVNPWNPLPAEYEDMIRPHLAAWLPPYAEHEIVLEQETLGAARGLIARIEAEGMSSTVCAGLRSLEKQREIVRRYTEKYGEEYVKRYVAVPGYSEHHTGLALDLLCVREGVPIRENSLAMKEVEFWEKVHSWLPEYGLILRYPADKEDITGIAYEPWHFRYVGISAAKEIAERKLSLEEYLQK